MKLIVEIRKRLELDFRNLGRRIFYVPDIDTKAGHYSKMVKLVRPSGEYGHIYFKPSQISGRYNEGTANRLMRVTEPPLTKCLGLRQITDFIDKPFSSEHYKCHTQQCERGVAITSSSVTEKTDPRDQLRKAFLKVSGQKSLFSEPQRNRLFPNHSKKIGCKKKRRIN